MKECDDTESYLIPTVFLYNVAKVQDEKDMELEVSRLHKSRKDATESSKFCQRISKRSKQ